MGDDLEDEIDPLEGTEGAGSDPRRIAAPTPRASLPPIASPTAGSTGELESLGLASHVAPRPGPLPEPDPGSTENLEAEGLASRTAAKPIAQPSAADSRLGKDQAEFSRLNDTGSGISQIAKAHPVAGGILHGLSAVGSIFAPNVTRMIPGTELHHDALLNQARGRIGEDLGEEQKQATTKEAGAHTEQAEAAAERDRAAAAEAGQPKPKEENWAEFPNFTDRDGTPLIREQNSGQVVRANDKKPPTGFEPIKTAAQPRPDTPEQQFIDEFQKTHPGGTVAQAVAAYANATQKPDKPQRQLAVINGKVVELVPGMDATGAQSIGGSEKAGAGAQAGQDALAYANDYMAGKKFTGPGDEALLEKYFELAKPSSGFRMTQAQIEMLQKARDLMGGLEAKAKHLFTPDAPYFSDTQRQQIVDTMSQLENSKGEHGGGAAQHGAAGAKDLGPAPAGKAEGATGKMPDGTKVIVKGGRLLTQ